MTKMKALLVKTKKELAESKKQVCESAKCLMGSYNSFYSFCWQIFEPLVHQKHRFTDCISY